MALATQAIAADDGFQDIVDLASGFTIEVTPRAAEKIDDFRPILREGTTVYITSLAGADFNDTISLAERLRREGFNPVPHFPARSLPNRDFVENALNRLVDCAGVNQVLLIAGAVSRPVGEFSDTMQLLETGLFDRFGIRRIGVAGHPEGSPDIPDSLIREALSWKNAFAERSDADFYLVTQFCFEAEPIVAWVKRIQSEGNRLPVRIGIPGLATVKTLLAHARACGIGPSSRILMKQAFNISKLMTTSAPDRLVSELAYCRARDPSCGIEGIHMYPLGGLKRTAAWVQAVAAGAFNLTEHGGFVLDFDVR